MLSGPKVVPGSIWAALAQHYAITRLISDVLGLPLIGFGQLEPILGIWNTAVPARGTSWGLVKTTYR